MKFSTTTCSLRVRLDWGGKEREGGRGSRVELTENKLILDQFYSTLFYFSSPLSVQMDHKLSNIFQSNSKYKVPLGQLLEVTDQQFFHFLQKNARDTSRWLWLWNRDGFWNTQIEMLEEENKDLQAHMKWQLVVMGFPGD